MVFEFERRDVQDYEQQNHVNSRVRQSNNVYPYCYCQGSSCREPVTTSRARLAGKRFHELPRPSYYDPIANRVKIFVPLFYR